MPLQVLCQARFFASDKWVSVLNDLSTQPPITTKEKTVDGGPSRTRTWDQVIMRPGEFETWEDDIW